MTYDKLKSATLFCKTTHFLRNCCFLLGVTLTNRHNTS